METWPWGLIRDGLIVLFCIGLLVRGAARRLRARHAPTLPAGSAVPVPFAHELGVQALRQQAETALAGIAAAVETERLRLQEHFQALAPPAAEARLDPARDALEEFPFRLGDSPGPAAWGRYEGVRILAREGLGCRQIAERLNLPRGEVELALKLQPASVPGSGGNFCPAAAHQA
ncbi:MAG: hypothetical protein EHM15_00715 [Desulfobacteraceae bacterium]|nr:MAG: hypothetical protein EHM15_00715 [Desulfobacteraceae bacterium]